MDRERKSVMIKALAQAEKILKDENVEFEVIMKNYIGFKIISKNVRMVVYPHKTSALNIHARVRNENSKDFLEYQRLQAKLVSYENNCTFTDKLANKRIYQ